MGEGRGKGKGTGWAKGLLIRSISEEGPISNIKDESDRSEDDPDRSEGIRLWPRPKKEGPKVTEEIQRSGGDPT